VPLKTTNSTLDDDGTRWLINERTDVVGLIETNKKKVISSIYGLSDVEKDDIHKEDL
jgi:hypothetical protein